MALLAHRFVCTSHGSTINWFVLKFLTRDPLHTQGSCKLNFETIRIIDSNILVAFLLFSGSATSVVVSATAMFISFMVVAFYR